jgi:hypothetical protein
MQKAILFHTLECSLEYYHYSTWTQFCCSKRDTSTRASNLHTRKGTEPKYTALGGVALKQRQCFYPNLPERCVCSIFFHGSTAARSRDLYLITNTHKIQTSMPTAGFEPAIPASERPENPILRTRGHWVSYCGDYKEYWLRIVTYKWTKVSEKCSVTATSGY